MGWLDCTLAGWSNHGWEKPRAGRSSQAITLRQQWLQCGQTSRTTQEWNPYPFTPITRYGRYYVTPCSHHKNGIDTFCYQASIAIEPGWHQTRRKSSYRQTTREGLIDINKPPFTSHLSADASHLKPFNLALCQAYLHLTYYTLQFIPNQLYTSIHNFCSDATKERRKGKKERKEGLD